jgi:hypothetical protein
MFALVLGVLASFGADAPRDQPAGPVQKAATRANPLDLLAQIDVQRDTIRGSWRVDRGVLQPAGWTDEHGPFIRIPVSVTGSYELRLRFSLSKAQEAVYIHVPIRNSWGLIVLGTAGCGFDNIEGLGELHGRAALPVNVEHNAVFRVSTTADQSVSLALILDGAECISWRGSGDRIVNNQAVWSVGPESAFGLDAKSGKILGMELATPFESDAKAESREAGTTRPIAADSPSPTDPPPTAAQADSTKTRAGTSFEQARLACKQRFRGSGTYKQLKSNVDVANAALDRAKASGDSADVFRQATRHLNAKKALADAEANALRSDPDILSAEASLADASRDAKLAHDRERERDPGALADPPRYLKHHGFKLIQVDNSGRERHEVWGRDVEGGTEIFELHYEGIGLTLESTQALLLLKFRESHTQQ